jgi:transglutaminase-like putative cysteine protease
MTSATAATATTPVAVPSRPRLLRWLAGPRQGWLSLLLLLVMLAATGLAIDEQQWMGLGSDGTSQTGLLPVLMVAAGITGSLLAWSRLSIGWVDLLAAIIGTAAGLLFAAAAVSDAPTVVDQLRELDASLARFLGDVLVRGIRTHETSAFLLTISALAWTSGVFAALSIFRRSHALGAIVPIGAMLMLEVIAAPRPQDIWLVIFAGASLLLVLRLDLEEQRDRWARRRIGGGQGVGALFLRGGAVVVAVMLVGSLLLATAAGSTSLSTMFPQLDAFVADLAASVQGLVGTTTSGSQGSNGEFPDRRPIGNAWTTDREVVFRADVFAGDAPYWRGAAYDQYADRTWRRTGSTTQDVAANEDLLTNTRDAAVAGTGDYDTVSATITSVSLAGVQLPAPQNPVTLDRAARVRLMGDDGTFQVLEVPDRLRVGGQYEVTALEPAIRGEDGLTIHRLLAGGTHYDAWLKPLSSVSPETAGQRTIDAAAAIRKRLPAAERDPYRLAREIQSFLAKSPDKFIYQPNIQGVCPSSETVSDCLLRTGKGFCQQYATTMVMMLRSLGVPSRYVEGFLPGRPGPTGELEIDKSAAHAWVEVWFNDVGWVPFDPTPGDQTLVDNGQQATDLPLGPDVGPGPDDTLGPDASGPAESFGPLPSESPLETANPDASPDPAGLGSDGSDGGPAGWLLVAGAIVGVMLVLGGVGFLWLRRFPGREPELAWRGVTSLATRFGFGPRPSQTPYEYTVSLSKVVPRVASDLRVVADAKVDATYSGNAPSSGSVAPLRHAYRRVRTGLLRLSIRRRRP